MDKVGKILSFAKKAFGAASPEMAAAQKQAAEALGLERAGKFIRSLGITPVWEREAAAAGSAATASGPTVTDRAIALANPGKWPMGEPAAAGAVPAAAAPAAQPAAGATDWSKVGQSISEWRTKWKFSEAQIKDALRQTYGIAGDQAKQIIDLFKSSGHL